VFAAGNIVGQFVRLYDKIGQDPPTQGEGLADAARGENYLSIFEASASDSGLLEPALVKDITAFYTFLKASRDATGALKLWEKPYEAEMKQQDVITIVYLCFLLSVHGHLALKNLIWSSHNFTIAEDVLAGVLLQCFTFLHRVLPDDDFRKPRITQRRPLCVELKKKYCYKFGPDPLPQPALG
jgi:hypothetical protein